MATLEPPKYIRIALDLAYKIYSKEFKVGEKVSGRSTLSSKYSVSPETIRRAVSLLKDMDVVNVSEKSGIYIKSYENAYLFIQKFNDENNVMQLKQKIKELTDQKNKIELEITKTLDLLLEYSMHFQGMNNNDSYELKISKNSHIISKTICDTEFRKYTNATIISIKRGNKTYISPGPYFVFNKGDIIRFICSKDNIDRVKSYIEASE